MKKYIAALGVAAMLTSAGCSFFQSQQSAIGDYDFSQMDLVQLREPEEGSPIATVYTTLGEFTVVLYPEYAPNIVSNFTKRVEEGFYNDRAIYAIEGGMYFLTGASDEEGTGGVTDDGVAIENEYSVNLWPYKGAMLSFYGQQGYGDSRFFVVNNVEFTAEHGEEIRAIVDEEGNQLVPEELIQSFVENDCVVGLSGYYCVFGQTIEGIDVIEALSNAPYDEDSKVPLEELKIEKIVLGKYKKG